MGIKLDEFIKHSNNPTIVDEGEILSISEKLIHLKLSDFMPVCDYHKKASFSYATKTLLNAFLIDSEKHLNKMSFEEFLYLLILALTEGDFNSAEDTMFVIEYHPTCCFRDLLVQKLAESMLSATNNQVIRRFLNINIKAFLDVIKKYGKDITSESRVNEIVDIIEKLTKREFDVNTTIRDIIIMSKNIGLQPWFPGTIPIQKYVVAAKKNVHLISLILVDCFNDFFQIEAKFNAEELLKKYDSEFKLLNEEMEDFYE
ncbi:MAG: hypothetical protein E7507_04425 [Ruminococcus sp.]|nr:hypothetical protein [Ruminococcus sp.]